MYVEYIEYQRFSHNPVVENDYVKSAPYADAFIDNWTLERVGKAVRNGEELPDSVKMTYAKIIDTLDTLTDTDGQVTSFSNGVDNYTFDTSTPQANMIHDLCIYLLPVEWCSACVSYEGGNAC